MGPLRNVRPEERSLTLRAFAVLFTLLFSHTLLETARDALFLTRASADRLPVVYLATAGVALLLTRRSSVVGTRAALQKGAWVASSSLGALAAGLALGLDPLVYVLYVASGILASTLLVHLFAWLGSALSIAQAKRLFPVIGLGSIVGALAGSAAATGLAAFMPPVGLVATAAAGFAAAGGWASLLKAKGAAETRAPETGWIERIKELLGEAYPRRVSAIVLASAATLTVADYLFKALVADQVQPEELGFFFARAYLILNALSLLSQLGLVAYLLKRFDLIFGLATLPVLLLLGTGVAWAAGGAVAALVIKAPEGVLKHSLHRTTMELLYVPLDDRTRSRIKSLLDLLGQRLGQALASAGIVVAASVSEAAVWLLLVVSSGAWLLACLNLRAHYLDLFRRRLRRGFGAFVRPPLTLDGLEAMFAGLDAEEPETVLAALRLLETEGRTQVVPGLILYHPSPQVVAAALDLFARTGRPRSETLVGRCFRHASADVREAAVGAWVRLTGQEVPRGLFDDGAANVRWAARVASGQEAELSGLTPALKETVARTIGRTGVNVPMLAGLLEDREPQVRRAAAEAAARAPDANLLDPLIERLQEKRLREPVMRALRQIPPSASRILHRFCDPTEAPVLRWELPEALAQVSTDPEDAAKALLDVFSESPDGVLRHRILLGLRRLCSAFEGLELDPVRLDQAIRITVARAYRHLDRTSGLERAARSRPEVQTEGHHLLKETLRDKQRNAVESLLQLVALRHPQIRRSTVQSALRQGDSEEQGAALELLESALKGPLRIAVVALVDGRPDPDALREGSTFHPVSNLDYAGWLRHMLTGGSVTIQDMVAFHVGELGWTDFLPELEARLRARPDSLDLQRAVDRLKGIPLHA